MKFYGRAVEVASQIVVAFQTGQIPEALATVYLDRGNSNRPMGSWSVLNQIACIICGCSDARGFDQWKQVKRCVRKGERAKASILIPLMGKAEGDDDPRIYGFKGVPVFDISQTDGEELEAAHPHRQFIDSLPLIQVAQNWKIQVDTYTGRETGPKGWYQRGGKGISLGVENMNTWLHELVHAADERCGNLKETGQHWRSETVAQLGACTLAKMIGRDDIADEGKTYEYIQVYAERANKTVESVCCEVIHRTAEAIDLILYAHECVTPV